MGLWGVLWELARAVVPHAAPHVARAVADRAKERRAAGETARTAPHPSNQDLAGALAYLEQRLSATEERAAAAEEKLSLAEARMSDQWAAARKWVLALLAWNVMVTAGLIIVIIVLIRR